MTKQEVEELIAGLKPVDFCEKRLPSPPSPEQEAIADALMVRLARIWLPEGSQHEFAECHYSKSGSGLYLVAPLSQEVLFRFAIGGGFNVNTSPYASMHLCSDKDFFLSFWHAEQLEVFGIPKHFKSDLPQEFVAQLKQLAEEWLPFFRRGCWLSGCPIEASAHEKAAWIQGFSREEIEAWNLKM